MKSGTSTIKKLLRFQIIRLAVFLLALGLTSAFSSTKISGTVRGVSGQTVAVETNEWLPALGEPVEFFFKLAGPDEEISVANGRVSKVEGDSVEVKIDNATGEVTKDQLVRITSENPQKRARPAQVPSAPGRDPSFAFVDMKKVFSASAQAKAAEVEINATRAEAKVELDRRTQALEAGIDQWRAEKEKEISAQADRLRVAIAAQLTASVQEAAAEAKSIVVDTSGLSQNGLTLFFFAPPPADQIASLKSDRGWSMALVDLASVFTRFHKTKEAETEINATKNAAKKTYDQMLAKKDNLAPNWRATKEKELSDLSTRKRNEIVSEILEKVRATLATDARVLAIDSEAKSTTGSPIVLYHTGVPECGDAIVAALNGSASGAPAKPVLSANLRFALVDLERCATAGVKEKILPALREMSTQGGYNLVFDRSGLSSNTIPFLISTGDLLDLTDELIARVK